MTIDWWTLGIQTVNVIVLVWLLQHFFWRPVAALIEQRRDTTRRSLAEAETAKAHATAALVEIEQTRAGFAREREAILAAARADGETTRAALLEDARRQAAVLQTAAQAAIEQADQAAAEAWRERSAHLAVAISGQLAARLDGTCVRAAFLDWLVREITALPDVARHAVLTSGTAIEVVSAVALDPAQQECTRDRVGKAFGGTLSILFRIDPALIAGLELHGPHLAISNSWRADLDRILAGLVEHAKSGDAPHSRNPVVHACVELNAANKPDVH